MKQLSGHAESVSRADPVSVCALLRAVDGYPSWHGEVVREVTVRERDRDRYPAKVDATLHIAIGPAGHDLELTLAASAEPPGRITLARLPNDSDDRETFVAVWELYEEAGTRIGLRLEACLDIPRLVPLGALGDRVAAEFVQAAATAADALDG